MTTLFTSIPEQEELLTIIDDLIDTNGRYRSSIQQFELNLEDIYDGQLIELLKLYIECKGVGIEEIYRKEYMENSHKDEEELIKYLEQKLIDDYSSGLVKVIDERCEKKIQDLEDDTGRYRRPEYEWSYTNG